MAELSTKELGIALVTAIAERNAAQVAACLEKGADVHHDNELPLRSAAYLGYADMADLLLQKGASVTVNGNEPLFIAVQARDADLINVLLKHGANVDALKRNKKFALDKTSLNIIDEIKSRATREAFQKNAAIVREKAKPGLKPLLKPKAPGFSKDFVTVFAQARPLPPGGPQ